MSTQRATRSKTQKAPSESFSTDFEPLVVQQTLVASQLAAIKAFYSARGALEVSVAGQEIVVAVEYGKQLDKAAEYGKQLDKAAQECRLDLMLGGQPGHLTLPRKLVDAWLQAADPSVDIAGLSPTNAALLLEAALAADLDWLDEQLGESVAIEAVHEANNTPIANGLALRIDHQGATSEVTLAFPDAWIIRLSALLDSFALSPDLPADIPIPVTILRAAATITLGEMESLEPGDVVIFEDDPAYPGACWALIGSYLVVPVVVGDSDLRPIASPRPINGSKWKWIMDHKKSDDSSIVSDASLTELPVTLSFELGRTTLQLGELRRIGPGSVIPLADVKTETVEILSSGKRIGHGNIVRIGDSLGVRVTRIFDKNA